MKKIAADRNYRLIRYAQHALVWAPDAEAAGKDVRGRKRAGRDGGKVITHMCKVAEEIDYDLARAGSEPDEEDEWNETVPREGWWESKGIYYKQSLLRQMCKIVTGKMPPATIDTGEEYINHTIHFLVSPGWGMPGITPEEGDQIRRCFINANLM